MKALEEILEPLWDYVPDQIIGMIDSQLEEREKQIATSALQEAAEKNFELYRELTDASILQNNKVNALKLKDMARGYKYAAKIILSLIPKE